MTNRDYEIISVEAKDIKQSHVLTGKINKIGRKEGEFPELGKADVNLDDGYGIVENIEVFYHCEDSDKAKGTETLDIPFREKDQVIVVNYGDIKTLDPDKMRIVGFKDGLPRYCTTQVVYVSIAKSLTNQRCFVWDVEENEFAVIRNDDEGEIISFPCDVRDVALWRQKQTNVTEKTFYPGQICGKEAPSCPEYPPGFRPYPSHTWSDRIEEPAGCGLGPEECPSEKFCNICERSSYANPGTTWRYGTGGWPSLRPLYYTPFSYGNSDYILNHACSMMLDFNWAADIYQLFNSARYPAKAFEEDEDGYFRTQWEYTYVGHQNEVLPTGAFPPYDEGYGEGAYTEIGTMKTFTHFCEGDEDDECIRKLEYSIIGAAIGYNKDIGPNSGTITYTDYPMQTWNGMLSKCSNKVVVHISNTIHKTYSVVATILGQYWDGSGTYYGYGEKTYKCYLDIIAQLDFYPDRTADVKVRELKRNPEFEQAVRDLDKEVREAAGIWPPGGESGDEPVETLAPYVVIYEVNKTKKI